MPRPGMSAPPDNGESRAVMAPPSQGPHEAVIARGVEVGSGDRSTVVDALGEGALAHACAGARDIEGGDRPVGGPQEAVDYKIGVNVESRDCSTSADAQSRGASAAEGCTGYLGIEGGEGAVGGPQETVVYRTRVDVVSRYCSFLVDAQREGALDQACAGARDV